MNYLAENNQPLPGYLPPYLWEVREEASHGCAAYGNKAENLNLYTLTSSPSENKNINNILVFVNTSQNEKDHYAFSNEIQVPIVLQLCKMLLLGKG